MSVHLSFTMLLSSDLRLRKSLRHGWFVGEKDHVHRGCSQFIWYTPRGSVSIWPICLIFGTNTTHEVAMWRAAPFSGQWAKRSRSNNFLKSMSNRLFEGFVVCVPQLKGSVVVWPNHFIYSTNTTHDVAMCCELFPGQNVKGQCHTDLSTFLHFPLPVSVTIWSCGFICGTRATQEVIVCLAPYTGQKIKGKCHTDLSKLFRDGPVVLSIFSQIT